jgi:hypothetical protein
VNEQVPQPLRNAAIAQLVSGLVNWFVMATFASLGVYFGATICTIVTMGFGFVTYFCACFTLMLVPIGIFEVVCGVVGLTNPRGAVGLMRAAAIVELIAVIFGGIPAFVVGILVLRWLADPEVDEFVNAAPGSA